MTSFDINEIEKFQKLAQEWWDPSGPMKPLHHLNPIRLQYIQDHCELSEKKILDVGCGGGLLSEAMAKASADVTGIDLAQNLIDVAKDHAQKKRVLITYECTSIENIAQTQPKSFDAITCMEMLEHVPDPQLILEACNQCLKPGGLLFLSTLNRNIKSFLFAILGAEYILQALPKGTHEYKKFIRPSELTAWASKAGFRLRDLKGIQYKPFSQTCSLDNDVSVNYIAVYEKK